MRKVISILSVLALSLSLTSCIPSGNIVGSATFTTIESSFGSPEQQARISINGGVTVTPKGARVRLTKANFSINSSNFTALKMNEFQTIDIPREEFVNSRLSGKNACGWLGGTTTSGNVFQLALFNPNANINSAIGEEFNYAIPANSQVLLIVINDNGYIDESDYWIGFAPANSLKIGGRNLCGNLGL